MLNFKNFLLVCLFSLTFSQLSTALNFQGTKIVKGKITNSETGSPESIDIFFKTSTGKRVKIKSNSITGEYEQLLNAGETYELSFIRWDVLNQPTKLTVEAEDKDYTAQTANFKIKILKEGNKIFSKDAFGKGSSVLSDIGQNLLKDLKKLLRFNRSLSINININASDSGDDTSLLSARMDAIKNFTKKWKKFNRKANYIESKGNPSDDLVVIVSKVENTLK